MTNFPVAARDTRPELFIDGFWTAAAVNRRDDVVITRGKPNEASQTPPSTCGLTLDNRDYRYKRDNPLSPYYGKIGRNTPLRVRVRTPSGTAGNIVANSTFETDLSGWQAYGFGYGGGSVAQSAVQAWQGSKSALVTWPTFAGTSFIGTPVELVAGRTYTLSFYAFVPAGQPDVRATLAFTSSSGYMSTKNAWTRIVHTFTAAANAPGVSHVIGVESASGTTAGQTCFIDGVMVDDGDTALTFTTTPPPIYSRHIGEISSWPVRWDESGQDSYMPIEAAGPLRRIGQGTQPVTSGLKGYYLSTNPVTYWPLDDGTEATRGAPAAGSYQGSLIQRRVGTAVYTFGDGVLGSHLGAGLRINDTTPATGFDWLGAYCVGSDQTPDALAWEFIYKPDPAIAGGLNMSSWKYRSTIIGTTLGTFDFWELEFRADGVNDDIRLVLTVDATGMSPTTINLADSAALAAITDGGLHHVRLSLTQDGADVDYVVHVDGVAVITGTRTTQTLRETIFASVFYDRLAGEDLLAFGHLIVWENLANIPPIATTSGVAHGFAGEPAGRRIERLCAETGTPFVADGDLDDTLAMGLQFEDYFDNQITEAEATDRGLVYESRDVLALAYRTRASLYNQAAAATLNAAQLAPPFDPTDDDQNLHNDIFAQRREGSSFRATLETGALSVQAPPLGVGRYKDEVAVNVQTDEDLPPVAGWLLALGTIDEARYPQITVSFATEGLSASESLCAQVLNIDVGDRIVANGLSGRKIYDDVPLLVLGYTETLNIFQHQIVFNCVPASVYDVAELDLAESRIDPGEESTLNAGINSSAVSIQIASAGPLWSTSGGDYPCPVVIGGEEMTLTAVSGASSPQTGTVTRSVNGVVKSHAAGAVIRLKRPGRIAL